MKNIAIALTARTSGTIQAKGSITASSPLASSAAAAIALQK
ncbi:MAG: hypothetical protein WBD83_20240 [Xanthobacteraceae bacterium]|jgi:hypothetical protein